jgi:hypothetical protein
MKKINNFNLLGRRKMCWTKENSVPTSIAMMAVFKSVSGYPPYKCYSGYAMLRYCVVPSLSGL